MRKIVDYKNVCGIPEEFDNWIKEMIKEGWQPLGGSSLTKEGNLIQAMVKYEKEHSYAIGSQGLTSVVT